MGAKWADTSGELPLQRGVLRGKLPARTLSPVEKKEIETAIESNKGNITKAAKAVGSSRRTFQKRMRDYKIPVGQSGRPRDSLPYGTETFTEKFIIISIILGIGFAMGYYFRATKPKETGLDHLGID